MSVVPISSPHEANDYVVVVYQNVMIQRIRGAIDASFLRASLAGHHAALNHDPTDLLAAMDKARSYGSELYTGVLYKNPSPPPTYDQLVRERQKALGASNPSPSRILDAFRSGTVTTHAFTFSGRYCSARGSEQM